MSLQERYIAARNITLIGAAVNAAQGIIKVLAGFFGQSHALIADGFHSFADLLTSVLVLFATKYGSQSADPEHPYGHARIETVATLGLALLIIVAGGGILLDAAWSLGGAAIKPDFYVLVIAILAVLANEVIFRYTLHVANRLRSELLRANAWHSRSDAAASLVVLIGISGSLLGLAYLDAIAAIVVGMMVIKMGWDLGWPSLSELIDTGIDEATLNTIKHMIESVPGVLALHQLRTRRMGGKIVLDVHVLVDPLISVSEGHYIGEQVMAKLLHEKADVLDVTVHVDPEDDQLMAPSHHLPGRSQVLAKLLPHFQTLNLPITDVVLHYLAGELHIEVRLPLAACQGPVSQEDTAYLLNQAIKQDWPFVAKIKILFY